MVWSSSVRDWKTSILQTHQNMSTCTAWFRKKFKTRLQKVPRAAQMGFYGSQGASFFFVTFSAWSACQVSDFCLLKILRDRAMDFLVELFRNLLEHPDWTMSQACTDSYTKTLKKFHGWLASSSFTVESFTLFWSIQSVEFYPHLVNCNLTVLAQEIIINIWFLEMWGLFSNWIVNLLGIRAW